MLRFFISFALAMLLPLSAFANEIQLDVEDYCDVCECIDPFDGCLAFSNPIETVIIGDSNGCQSESWLAWCTPLFCAPPALADNVQISVTAVGGSGFYYIDILGPDCEWVNIRRGFNGTSIQTREIDTSEFGDCAFTWRVRTEAGSATVNVDHVSITWDCV